MGFLLGHLVHCSCSVNISWFLKSRKAPKERWRHTPVYLLLGGSWTQVSHGHRLKKDFYHCRNNPGRNSIFFLTILLYAWNKTICQFNLIHMLCGGDGSGGLRFALAGWWPWDGSMFLSPLLLLSSLVLVWELFAPRTASHYVCGCCLAEQSRDSGCGLSSSSSTNNNFHSIYSFVCYWSILNSWWLLHLWVIIALMLC